MIFVVNIQNPIFWKRKKGTASWCNLKEQVEAKGNKKKTFSFSEMREFLQIKSLNRSSIARYTIIIVFVKEKKKKVIHLNKYMFSEITPSHWLVLLVMIHVHSFSSNYDHFKFQPWTELLRRLNWLIKYNTIIIRLTNQLINTLNHLHIHVSIYFLILPF